MPSDINQKDAAAVVAAKTGCDGWRYSAESAACSSMGGKQTVDQMFQGEPLPPSEAGGSTVSCTKGAGALCTPCVTPAIVVISEPSSNGMSSSATVHQRVQNKPLLR